MIIMTFDEVRAAFNAQGVHPADYAWVCPVCKTVQSARDFAAAGVSADEANSQVGFSCIGRWRLGWVGWERAFGQGCDWTLGGQLQIHELEIVDEDGRKHPYFAIATPDQAQEHAARHAP